MTIATDQLIIFDNVSKFYGEILGVKRVNLQIAPGITSLVGPNGAGKSTLMNLMTGLLRPTRGTITLLGIPTDHPEQLFRRVGYGTQFDSFPRGLTGREFLNSFLLVHGYERRRANELSQLALERVNLVDAADRKVAGYSKGMRQRIRLAQAIAHEPAVLILDEPLNGLDPMVRSETIALFRKLAAEGLHLIISSHILHEVDMMSDRVVLLNNGYIVAEGNIHGVRDEMEEHPMQILIRCDQPAKLAAYVFAQDHVVEARLHDDKRGLFVKTKDADGFYLMLNRAVADGEVNVESISPVDDDLSAADRIDLCLRSEEELSRPALDSDLPSRLTTAVSAIRARDRSAARQRVERLQSLWRALRNALQRPDPADRRVFWLRVDLHEPVSRRDHRSQSALLLSQRGAARGAGGRQVRFGAGDHDGPFHFHDRRGHVAALPAALLFPKHSLFPGGQKPGADSHLRRHHHSGLRWLRRVLFGCWSLCSQSYYSGDTALRRSEEHTSELQSRFGISYA